MGKNSRIESLDFLRGIAACMVVLFHYTAESSIHLSGNNLLRVVGVYGHLGVHVFFILSGFVIPYSMYVSSYKINLIGKFLIKRTIRIEIPYLALIVIEVLMIYVSSLTPWKSGPSERLNVYHILLHVGYLNGILGKPWLIPVFWTLAIEFQFYLLMAIVFPLFLYKKFSIRILILTGIALLSFTFPQPYLLFCYGLFFLVGIITFQLMVGIMKPIEFFALLTGLLFLICINHGYLSSLIVVVTITIILFFKCNWKLGTFFGMISYSVYLIHVPFGGRLLMLTQLYVRSEWIKSLLIIGYFALTIFAAWIFYLLIEKPSLHLSKKITYTKFPEVI